MVRIVCVVVTIVIHNDVIVHRMNSLDRIHGGFSRWLAGSHFKLIIHDIVL